jgi:hypothetical protein
MFKSKFSLTTIYERSTVNKSDIALALMRIICYGIRGIKKTKKQMDKQTRKKSIDNGKCYKELKPSAIHAH